MKFFIDISTKEKEKEIYEQFLTFKKKGDIFKYYGVSDNTTNTNYLKIIGEKIGFDFSIYKKKNKKFCVVCGKELEKEQKKFCSHSCSAKFNNKNRKLNTETIEKIKNGLSKFYEKNGKKINIKHSCEFCGKEITYKRKFCSIECKNNFNYIKNNTKKSLYALYKAQCFFKFNLSDYKENFDFSLIEENGWYKAYNRGNNLNGISRDHRFSIKDGFEKRIDPYFISHPVNCMLMKHDENSSKGSKSSITVEELYKLVNEWNEKYGYYENKINYFYIKSFLTENI